MIAVIDWIQQLDLWHLLVVAADIAIVAFVIYRVLLLLRGTGAAYMLIGLLGVAGVYLGAHAAELSTLSWLLDHVISYMILIVIIVFQADIRRGLMRVGRRIFHFSDAPSEEVSAIDELVRACEVMAARRTGALIVFEREANLEAIIERGVPLEARASKELLHNIFAPWPDNPLHDGAVVIKNSWVRQVGAVLPLSMKPDLDDALGTRHRAAVGITEETDAVAVVVSEQRGAISICEGGRLHANLSAHQLEQQLRALLGDGVRGRWHWLGRLVRRVEATIIRDGGEAPELELELELEPPKPAEEGPERPDRVRLPSRQPAEQAGRP